MSAEETKAVARRPDRTPLSQRDPVALAQHFFKSGYFTDTKSLSQAVVKIVAGEELGLGPMTSMQGVHIIKGKPSLSANLHAVQVKRSEKYNFRPVKTTDKLAKIEWFEDAEAVGFSEYTIEQAKTAGLLKPDSGWARNPEDMLFARALTRGIRRYCPEVSAGSPAYVPEELGAEVDDEGEPIYVENEEEAVEPTEILLDADTVERLAKGIDLAGYDLDALNLLLGSKGIDALDPVVARDPQLAKLSEEDAQTIEAELQKVLDADAPEAGAEGEEVTDADA